MSALVTPGNLRSALAVTRSLGRRGVSVTVAEEHPKTLAGSSRYCRAAIRVPSPERNGEAFVSAIHEEACRGAHRVIIPADDVTLSLLAEARPRFEGLVALPFPDPQTIHLAHDKGALMSLAQEKEIPVPKTVIIRDPADLTEAIRQVGLPAVVKPRRSRFQQGDQWINGSATRYVHTPEELELACRVVHTTAPFPLVQEYIPGEGRGVFLLMNHGQVRAAFAHRRIHEKPPSGGVSVLSESVSMDPQLLKHSRRLLEGLKWHGAAMVEFKRDTRDGVPKLIEINGRFWGSLQLAVDAGIDFPYLLYRLALHGEVEPAFSYKEGIRLRWWLGDLDWLFLTLRGNKELGARLRAFHDFVRPSGKMTQSEVFRWNDPRPALEELSQYALHILRSMPRWVND